MYVIGRGNNNQSIRAGKKYIKIKINRKKVLPFVNEKMGNFRFGYNIMVKVGQISRGRSSHRAGIDI